MNTALSITAISALNISLATASSLTALTATEIATETQTAAALTAEVVLTAEADQYTCSDDEDDECCDNDKVNRPETKFKKFGPYKNHNSTYVTWWVWSPKYADASKCCVGACYNREGKKTYSGFISDADWRDGTRPNSRHAKKGFNLL